MAIQATVAHDYMAFYREAVAEREAASYPPFARLVNIVVSGESLEDVRLRTQEVADALQALPDAAVLGPAQCAIERVQNRWRRHVLVKLSPDADATPVAELMKSIAFKKASAIIDVDPYSLV
jgi:primosomal protein N' (replication factor Y)